MGGEECDIMILFVDICNYFSILENLLLEELIEFFNWFLLFMIDMFFWYGVIIDKYVGDFIIVFWNVFFVIFYYEWIVIEVVYDMVEEFKVFNV